MELIGKMEHGPARRFGDAEVYLFLSLLKEGGKISRRGAAEYLGLGEGSVRKIADIAKKAGLIHVFQTGIRMSDYGDEFLSGLPLRMVNMEPIDSVVGSSQQAVLVKGMSYKITNGMMQRDAGIRAGSSGCTTFVIRNGRMTVPPDWDADRESPELSELIRNVSGMAEDDVLIIGGDDDPPKARTAALTAALELL
ncbi:MAG: hypothetical protein LBJ20_05420 [Candidatus Methanoplasma sp.]|jgi:hypothetical protein|nr:hypothetical protein [Candidatus Methanoplasma sp.]